MNKFNRIILSNCRTLAFGKVIGAEGLCKISGCDPDLGLSSETRNDVFTYQTWIDSAQSNIRIYENKKFNFLSDNDCRIVLFFVVQEQISLRIFKI